MLARNAPLGRRWAAINVSRGDAWVSQWTQRAVVSSGAKPPPNVTSDWASVSSTSSEVVTRRFGPMGAPSVIGSVALLLLGVVVILVVLTRFGVSLVPSPVREEDHPTRTGRWTSKSHYCQTLDQRVAKRSTSVAGTTSPETAHLRRIRYDP